MTELEEEYVKTGFSPEDINKMYEALCATNSLISRLICGDLKTVNEAVQEANWWLFGFDNFRKEGLH